MVCESGILCVGGVWAGQLLPFDPAATHIDVADSANGHSVLYRRKRIWWDDGIQRQHAFVFVADDAKLSDDRLWPNLQSCTVRAALTMQCATGDQ